MSICHGPIIVKKLESGYYHVRGVGPLNWAQPQHWPCNEDELRRSSFPEASEEFILDCLALMHNQKGGADKP